MKGSLCKVRTSFVCKSCTACGSVQLSTTANVSEELAIGSEVLLEKVVSYICCTKSYACRVIICMESIQEYSAVLMDSH